MKGLRTKDMLGTEPEALQATLQKLEEDLFKNRLKQMTNQLENTMVIRNARRDIARVKMVLADKARQGAATAETAKKG
jgi:large subunit ribosomal protein L29